jgi:DNA-binding NarL/FixJ family response regulator
MKPVKKYGRRRFIGKGYAFYDSGGMKRVDYLSRTQKQLRRTGIWYFTYRKLRSRLSLNTLPCGPAIAYNCKPVATAIQLRKARPGLRLRILIADTHVLTADSLFSIISQSRGDCELVGYASGIAETVSLCARLKPDLLVLDSAISGQSGVRILPEIKKATPATRILLYCTTANESEILDAIRKGADGFLEKSCSRSDFVAAIDRVLAGESHLCARSLNALARALRGTGREELRDRNKLTTREKEILLLVAEGNSSKEIARKLFVGVSTVETHRANQGSACRSRICNDVPHYLPIGTPL